MDSDRVMHLDVRDMDDADLGAHIRAGIEQSVVILVTDGENTTGVQREAQASSSWGQIREIAKGPVSGAWSTTRTEDVLISLCRAVIELRNEKADGVPY